MSDDAEQQLPQPAVPQPPAPSPQMFARPGARPAGSLPAASSESLAAAAPATDAGAQDDAERAGAAESRFPSTGDPRVDRALADLPDPAAHHRSAGDRAEPHGDGPHGDGAHADAPHRDGEADAAERLPRHDDSGSGIDLPAPGLLDRHIGDVTSVHRQLQQRLSDLSG
ncbi:hypothetical protein [Flexivirga sp.]|uniref:hypothetical protein n=1 Tax=Flexivirga sp. TaxID=1962927 RepID=UPI003F81B5DB